MGNQVIVLTGEKQTGKTTLLRDFCMNKANVAGILTPVNDEKRFFYEITSGLFFNMELENPEEERLEVGKYAFSLSAFKRATQIIMSESCNQLIEYLIIDEIGPLEIKAKSGFYQTLLNILEINFHFKLILVVRPSLIVDVVDLIEHYNKEVQVFDIFRMNEFIKTDTV